MVFGFFCLYSIGLPILTYEGNTHLRANYTKELMEIQLLAMFIILFVISPQKVGYKLNNRKKKNINLGIFNKIIYIGMILVLLGGIFFLSRSNLGGKASIYASGSSLLLAIFRIPLILTMLYTLLMIIEWQNSNKISIKNMLIIGSLLFGISMYSGERFYFPICSYNVNIFIFYWKVKKKTFVYPCSNCSFNFDSIR